MERANDFNFGLDKTKAAYLPQPFAFPMKYVIDSAVCLGASCGKCVEACEVKAVDLAMAAKTMNINVGAVIWATGWDSYDIAKLHNYGSGTVANAISNIMMERLAALQGPPTVKSFAHPMVKSLRILPLYSVRVPVMRTTRRHAPLYAVWQH
ncbi:hypothetical protein N752_17020 [Desulforamulus aquiferis]|nr:hypothetical protein N752_17020 [Desulforamulus aquiferis]